MAYILNKYVNFKVSIKMKIQYIIYQLNENIVDNSFILIIFYQTLE